MVQIHWIPELDWIHSDIIQVTQPFTIKNKDKDKNLSQFWAPYVTLRVDPIPFVQATSEEVPTYLRAALNESILLIFIKLITSSIISQMNSYF